MKAFRRCRSGFSGVDGERQAGFGGHLETFVSERELAHDRVVESFGPCSVVSSVVAGPADPELLAARGELADEVV